jgi:hypothetical protein
MVPSTSYTLNGKTIEREDNTAILDTGSATLFLFTHLQTLTALHFSDTRAH